MSNLICKNCGYTPLIMYGDIPFKKNRLNHVIINKCKCDVCAFIEVDEEIFLAMKILITKNYMTNFSCGGHLNKLYNNSYIYFSEPIPKELFPKSEWLRVTDNNDAIRGINRLVNKYDKINDYSLEDMCILQEDINMFRLELLKWAISLPVKE